jgi:hypothetical protein
MSTGKIFKRTVQVNFQGGYEPTVPEFEASPTLRARAKGVVDTIQKLRDLKINTQVINMEGVVIEGDTRYLITLSS